jgi:hypothetical protein
MSLLRRDGAHALYFVQHFDSGSERWVLSDVGHLLFPSYARGPNPLTWDERQGPLGDHFRALISDAEDAWQETGLDGTESFRNAMALVKVLRERRPDREFRVVRVAVAQITEVVA